MQLKHFWHTQKNVAHSGIELKAGFVFAFGGACGQGLWKYPEFYGRWKLCSFMPLF